MPHELIFSNQRIADFTKSLGSSASTPGGGAAAGLAAAQGASLIGMVCNLTLGKPQFAPHEALIQEVLTSATQLESRCLDLMDQDAIAFYDMIAVYKMAKSTPEEEKVQKEAKEKALKTCTMPPIALMEAALEGVALAQSIFGKSNTHAVSDLGVAATFFQSALESSWLNVVINLGEVTDGTFVAEYQQRGETLLKQGKEQAQALYQAVLTSLTEV